MGALGLLGGVLVGCSANGGGVDLELVTDREAPVGRRASLIERLPEAVRGDEVDAGAAYEALKVAAWQRASSAERVRVPSVDALLEFPDRMDETRAMLRLMLPTEPFGAGAMVERISELAGEGGWTEFAPALIRRWARPLAGFESVKDRPERSALRRLFPERTPEDLVFAYFVGEMEDPDERLLSDPAKTRLGAWDLLTGLEPDRDRLLARLRGARRTGGGGGSDATVSTLASAATDLGVAPVTSSELAWLLRLGADRAAWDRARGAVARLSAEQREGLAMRHIPALVWAGEFRPGWLAMSRDALLGECDGLIAERDRFVRTPEVVVRVHAERIDDWRDVLSWGDALVIRATLEAISEPGVEAAMFVVGETDKGDTSTEHGGTITPRAGAGGGGGFDVIHYPPRATERTGDHAFVASESMHEESTLSLVHFHMHAQRYSNAAYAGPSAVDLAYAREHQRACVVFTFLDERTLNADYYQPDGAIIDLGSLKRR